MSFLTQLGVLAVILIIVTILIKSNQTLEKIYMEEEKEENKKVEKPDFSQIEVPKIKAPKVEMPKWSLRKKEEREEEKEPVIPERKRKKDTGRGKQDGNRSMPTVPMEQHTGLIVEILDERGRACRHETITSFPFSIGRNEENDLVLDDLSVSGYHACLEEEDGNIVLYDQGSLNRLVVDGRQETKVPIYGEMTVGFGNSRLRFIKEEKRTGPTLFYEGTSLMEEWR